MRKKDEGVEGEGSGRLIGKQGTEEYYGFKTTAPRGLRGSVGFEGEKDESVDRRRCK